MREVPASAAPLSDVFVLPVSQVVRQGILNPRFRWFETITGNYNNLGDALVSTGYQVTKTSPAVGLWLRHKWTENTNANNSAFAYRAAA